MDDASNASQSVDKQNLVDRVVTWFSPKAGAERYRYRKALDVMRGYEAAAVTKRTSGWKTTHGSAVSEVRVSLKMMRSRSRDLVRSNGWAKRAVNVIANSIVGAGIRPQAQAKTKAQAERRENLWREWGETTACDYYGQHDIYGLQNLAAKAIAESGSVLVRRVVSPKTKPVPLKIQLLESDYLDVSRDVANTGGTYITGGIQFDADGQREGYWLFDNHPGDLTFGAATSKFVPADQVQHVFRVDRPGQIEGVPWGAPVIIRLRDQDEFADAQLVRQKIAACFAVFVEDNDVLGGAKRGNKSKDGEIIEKVEPAMIEVLPSGKKVSFANPPSVENIPEYMRFTMHEIAAGYEVPYTALTGDLSDANFASGRLGRLDFQRDVRTWQQVMFIPQFCQTVWRWFDDLAVISGVAGDRQTVTAKWTPPPLPMTDPEKEITAYVRGVRSGVMTLPQVVAERGRDFAEHVEEIVVSNKALDDNNLILDSDPRHVSQQGQAQKWADSEPPDDEGETKD